MKQLFRLLICYIVLSCCSACTTVYDVTALNRQRLLRLALGMDRHQVTEMMGTQTYSICQSKFPVPLLEGRNPENNEYCFVFYNSFLTIENPYQTKELTVNKHYYVIDYYVTGHLTNGQEVSNAVLTPIVYEKQVLKQFDANGMFLPHLSEQRVVLVGWGWDFMNEIHQG